MCRMLNLTLIKFCSNDAPTQENIQSFHSISSIQYSAITFLVFATGCQDQLSHTSTNPAHETVASCWPLEFFVAAGTRYEELPVEHNQLDLSRLVNIV